MAEGALCGASAVHPKEGGEMKEWNGMDAIPFNTWNNHMDDWYEHGRPLCDYCHERVAVYCINTCEWFESYHCVCNDKNCKAFLIEDICHLVDDMI